MSGLLRILTAVVFTAHLTVGCCSHHAHACDGQGHLPPAQGTATTHGQCPESPGSAAEADHANHGPQECQGGKCSVASQRATGSNPFPPPSHAFVAPLLDSASSLVGAGSEQHFFSAGRLLLPVRLHLANQVLLI